MGLKPRKKKTVRTEPKKKPVTPEDVVTRLRRLADDVYQARIRIPGRRTFEDWGTMEKSLHDGVRVLVEVEHVIRAMAKAGIETPRCTCGVENGRHPASYLEDCPRHGALAKSYEEGLTQLEQERAELERPYVAQFAAALASRGGHTLGHYVEQARKLVGLISEGEAGGDE